MDWTAVNWADYVIVGILALSIIISVFRGFIREALSLATWILSFWAAMHFSPVGASWLSQYWDSEIGTLLVSFVSLFLCALILGTMISFFVCKLVQKTGLTGTDRLLGVLFGFGRGVLLLALMVMFAQLTRAPDEDWWQRSVLIPQLEPLATWLSEFMPESLMPQEEPGSVE